MAENRVPPGLRVTDSTGDDYASSIPPGWDENPTAWPKRLALAALALAGLAAAFYLALFQLSVLYFPSFHLGFVESVWDPFFDSREVLDYLKWPDAVPGVLAYGGEVVLNFAGDKNRWRTAPWVVIAFSLIIFPGAAVSIVLMAIQPVFVGTWCSLCLVSAFVSFIICGLGADEALATLQHLKRVRDSGGSVTRALWGDGLKGLVPIPLREGRS